MPARKACVSSSDKRSGVQPGCGRLPHAQCEHLAHRGTIYDRNGNVLATSVDAMTIYANPKEIEDVSSAAETVASALGGDAGRIRRAAQAGHDVRLSEA